MIEQEDTQEGRTYRVNWDDCCVQGSFESVLTRKNWVPDPTWDSPFLESLTFANGVTISGTGVGLEEVTEPEAAQSRG